jgi:hypothetical protein
MSDGFLRPPGLGIWLMLVSGAAVWASLLWPVVAMPAVLLVLVGGGIALGVVGRWLGRCVGYAAGWFVQEVSEGWREGRAGRADPPA